MFGGYSQGESASPAPPKWNPDEYEAIYMHIMYLNKLRDMWKEQV